MKFAVMIRAYFLVSMLSVCLFFTVAAPSVLAAYKYPVHGFGWLGDNLNPLGFCTFSNILDADGYLRCAGGIGWISYSNMTDGSSVPYNVVVDGGTGEVSGYAWSSNVGWITFNMSDMSSCASVPGDSCPVGSPTPFARIDVRVDNSGNITGGTGLVSGWGRVCAVFQTGCTGTLRSNLERGGWDGWISLSGTGYGLQLDPVTKMFLTPTTCPTCYIWAGGGSNGGFGWGINLLGTYLSTIPPDAALTFLSDKTRVASGETVKLSWESHGAETCSGASSPASRWSGNVGISTTPPSGFVTDPITQETMFYLTCADSLGNYFSASPIKISLKAPEQGVCGSADGVASWSQPVSELCSVGTAGVVRKEDGIWKWICSGVDDGPPSEQCDAPSRKGLRFFEF